MARVQKKDKAVETKQTVKPEASGVTGIKEESEKGELFFKIVLIVMSVALLGLIIYFVVDAIIGDGTTTDEKRYNKNNYLTVAIVNEILSGNDNASVENLSRAFFESLENEDFNFIYIVFYNSLAEEGSAEYNRQEEVLGVVDDIFEQFGQTVIYNEGKDDEYSYVVVGDETAIFFVDISDPNNATWSSFINDSDYPGNKDVAPVMLRFDLNEANTPKWFGPSGSATYKAAAQLQNLLNDLKNAE
ncbi:MAG TPA: hypothetical protein VIK67_00095 [Acholeplasma sp.]|jgi:hypothetical protein